MKALTSDSTPVVVKLYTRQDEYENEKKIYEWLESKYNNLFRIDLKFSLAFELVSVLTLTRCIVSR